MHVLDAQGAAVGVAQDVEDLVEGGHVPAGQPVGHELAREVPDGQPVVRRVQLRVEVGRLGVEGVQVGDQVATHPVEVDQVLDVDLLDQALVEPVGRVLGGIGVDVPTHRFVGDLQGLEDVVVEVVVPHEAFGHVGQEETGLGPLDDAVVVGRREGDRLADAQVGQGAGVGRLEARRVAEGPDAHDHPLARHEAGHGLDGPEGPRVGERHRRPGEVVGGDAVAVHLAH